ncbi:DUF1636 family protein [Shimia marina]|uniref:DUF1636 family protein n=1 Tax=Shimia marina TaxID=321267 RepID=UPI00278C42EC|nr:DUF1636 family protein [Shimia marina]
MVTNLSEQTILICSRCCGASEARHLKAALTGHVPSGTKFRAVDCLAGCDFPPVIGLQGAGKASYLFGAISTPQEIAGFAEFSLQYADSKTGWTSSTERPVALQDKTLARLPALFIGR